MAVGRSGTGHCAGDGELAGDQGGAGQPGKKSKKRMRMQHFCGNRVFLVAR